MKKPLLILSLVLIIAAGTGILLETRFRDDIRIQRLLARFFILSDERLLKTAADLRQRGAPESIELYREVLSRDRLNPLRWCDLGDALLDFNRTEEARDCYRRAGELGPNDTQTLWRLMESYQRLKELPQALRYGSRILDNDPATADSLFYLYLESGFDFADTLRYGIPPRSAAAHAYLRYLIRYGDVEKAQECWNWMAEPFPADERLAGEYAAFLIRAGEPALARAAWSAWLGGRATGYLQTNFLYNPGFESEPGPSPFDWKIAHAAGAEVGRDRSLRREGSYSLRIVFDGKENPSYRHVGQTVFLDPGRYRLSGFVRAEGITSDKGIGFRIGPYRTEQVTGAGDWKKLEVSFDIKEPFLGRVEVFRDPSGKIASWISGTAWIDDVTLTRADAR